MNARKYILVLSCLFASGLFAGSDGVPVLTVCEVMSGLKSLDGKIVIVVGRFGHTDEGVWLDEECGQKVLSGGARICPLDLGRIRGFGFRTTTSNAKTLQMG